jgi:hypothetical protein
MNTQNLAYLHNTLKYLGFGGKAKLLRELEEMMGKNQKDFQLTADYDFSDTCRMDVSLFFRRAEETDRYYFNKFTARLTYSDPDIISRSQLFYIDRGHGVTCKEAFNLLQGRSVYKGLFTKEGAKYYAWLQLNFAERDKIDNYKVLKYYENYGFDLETILERFRIREMNIPQLRDALLKSLRRGNIHPVTLSKEEPNNRMLVEACPQFKTINLYPETTPGQIPGSTADPEVVEVPSDADEQNLPFWNDEEEEPDQADSLFKEQGATRRRTRKKIA